MKTLQHLILSCCLCIFSNNLSSQDNSVAGARYAAMGGVSVIADDVWACALNQGGLGFIRQTSAALSFNNQYGINELNKYNLSLALPAGKGAFGLSYSQFGNAMFNRQKTGIAYGMRLTPRLGAGVQMDWIHTALGLDYGQKSLFTFEAGIQAEIYSDIFASAHLFNPLRVKIADYADERLPSSLAFGMLWKINSKLGIAAELEKNEISKPALKAGLEYYPINQFAIRGGINSLNAEVTFGAGYKTKTFTVDLATSLHPQLGLSTQLSANFRFGRVKQ